MEGTSSCFFSHAYPEYLAVLFLLQFVTSLLIVEYVYNLLY
jgi:hypothetical protein